MTAHAAKGLEFVQVFILRANSNSFPAPYKEPLLEFPRELHDPASVAQDDDKELCKQEERRLFYVAMTRARDSLTIYAKQGRAKDPSPSRIYARSLERFQPARPLAGARLSLADFRQTCSRRQQGRPV